MIRGYASFLLASARLFALAPFLVILPSNISAQPAGMNSVVPIQDSSVVSKVAPGSAVLIFKLFSESPDTPLERQGLLKLVNLADNSATWRTVNRSQGVFNSVPYGNYEVEVSAVGYVAAQRQLQVIDSSDSIEIEFVLHRDPSAIDFDAANSIMSEKARKKLKNAVLLLKSGNLARAQKQLDDAYKLAPGNADLKFLMGYLYFKKKDFARANAYLAAAANLSPNDARVLTLLGRNGLEQGDNEAARSALERAVAADDDNWLPHGLLADAYLQQGQYENARDQSEVAIRKGKAAAAPAELILGESLFALGREQEGIQALAAFLDEAPRNPMAVQVQNLIPSKDTGSFLDSPATDQFQKLLPDPLPALPTPLEVRSWRPPAIDEVKISVAPEVGCPLTQVLEQSGQRVEKLVEDVDHFGAIEDLLHQVLDDFGIAVRTQTRKYNYVVSISEPQAGVLDVNEDRAEKLTLEGYPDNIATTGFAALALVFHPHRRNTFEMECEGLGDWQGQASWIVHFRQRNDRPNYMHSYKVGKQYYPIALMGRAWIRADDYQIMRMESDIVRPIPEIQLLSEHQIVQYGPILFRQKNTTLWLPKSAEIYFDFRKHRYYRRHRFDHYMLFSVDSGEKPKRPPIPSKGNGL